MRGRELVPRTCVLQVLLDGVPSGGTPGNEVGDLPGRALQIDGTVAQVAKQGLDLHAMGALYWVSAG
jgi:hypothetical protein